MVKVNFKNLKHSDIIKNIVQEKIASVYLKFPQLKNHHVNITLEMQNSPSQPGPDLFSAKLTVQGRRFKSLVLEKKSINLYLSISELSEALLERLNRANDKFRVRERKQSRELLKFVS